MTKEQYNIGFKLIKEHVNGSFFEHLRRLNKMKNQHRWFFEDVDGDRSKIRSGVSVGPTAVVLMNETFSRGNNVMRGVEEPMPPVLGRSLFESEEEGIRQIIKIT